MAKPSPDHPEPKREPLTDPAAARAYMQAAIDRVEARRRERLERAQRSFFRRLFGR